MTTITKIDRLGVCEVLEYPKDWPGHKECPCKACRFPYGELVHNGKPLGVGPNQNVTLDTVTRLISEALVEREGIAEPNPDIVTVMARDAIARAVSGEKGIESVEIVGYGDCKNAKKVERLIVSFELDNRPVGANVVLDPAATDSDIKAAIAAWAEANPVQADPLTGRKL